MLITLWLMKWELALRLTAAVPSLAMQDALSHVAAAVEYAQPEAGISAELLLAVAYIESKYDPTSVSRLQSGVRKMGRYPSTKAPRDLEPRSMFCGPLQTIARSWRQCLAQRSLDVGYRTGAAELAKWLRDRRVRGDVVRALAGHGCGNRGAKTGRCSNRYPHRVLRFERRLTAPAKPRVLANT